MSRPASTLVIVTRDALVRADHGPGPAPIRQAMHRRERPTQGDLADLVELALSEGGRPGKRLWVLSADLWLQTQALPKAAVGLAPDEVAGALRFEAEALSGISGADSVVAFVPAGEGDAGPEVLLVQVATADVARLEARLQRLGVRLAGLLHPAALRAAVDGQTAPWGRVELWPELVVCLQAADGAAPSVHVMNEPPGRGAWRAEADAFFTRSGATSAPRQELFAGGAGAAAQLLDEPEDGANDAPGARRVDLDRPADLGRWVDAWAAALAAPAVSVPAIGPSPRPPSPLLGIAVSALLALAAGAACFGHHRMTSDRRAQLARALEQAETPGRELARLTAERTQAERRLQELRVERVRVEAELRSWQEGLVLQRRRHAALLDAVARQRDASLVVERVTDASGVVVLSGRCVRPDAANALSTGLARELATSGWTVQPAEVQLGAPGTYLFRIPIASTGRSAPPPSRPSRPGGSS